jgi:hypothetical protein
LLLTRILVWGSGGRSHCGRAYPPPTRSEEVGCVGNPIGVILRGSSQPNVACQNRKADDIGIARRG